VKEIVQADATDLDVLRTRAKGAREPWPMPELLIRARALQHGLIDDCDAQHASDRLPIERFHVHLHRRVFTGTIGALLRHYGQLKVGGIRERDGFRSSVLLLRAARPSGENYGASELGPIRKLHFAATL
jgi:hypothetical protein